MITLKVKGNFSKTERYLNKAKNAVNRDVLLECGDRGLEALMLATPVDSGVTADSWSYDIIETKDSTIIEWKNSNSVNGVNIAILLQYDHTTGTGGFVKGIDYINPAMKPVFDDISEKIRKEVS